MVTMSSRKPSRGSQSLVPVPDRTPQLINIAGIEATSGAVVEFKGMVGSSSRLSVGILKYTSGGGMLLYLKPRDAHFLTAIRYLSGIIVEWSEEHSGTTRPWQQREANVVDRSSILRVIKQGPAGAGGGGAGGGGLAACPFCGTGNYDPTNLAQHLAPRSPPVRNFRWARHKTCGDSSAGWPG